MAVNLYKKKRLAVITLAYWFLLVYITAALIWWFIALMHQNKEITDLKNSLLKKNEPAAVANERVIAEEYERKTAQYIGEGATFMLVILVGAVFVYRATRKQIKLTHQQQNFMMSITHELKTPIAVVKLNLETLQKHKLEEAQQARIIHNTLQETDRLNDLCNNILLASQLDAGDFKLAWEEVNLSNLVKKAALQFQSRFPNRKISYRVDENISISGDELLLKLAINNLIENALKYSPGEEPVLVELENAKDGIKLKVTDQGPAIPDHEKSKIFEKFYRLGDENTRRVQGTGLGLYLTRKIAEDHNATVEVWNNSPRGSIFVINFQHP